MCSVSVSRQGPKLEWSSVQDSCEAGRKLKIPTVWSSGAGVAWKPGVPRWAVCVLATGCTPAALMVSLATRVVFKGLAEDVHYGTKCTWLVPLLNPRHMHKSSFVCGCAVLPASCCGSPRSCEEGSGLAQVQALYFSCHDGGRWDPGRS